VRSGDRSKNRGWTQGLELGVASIPHILATDAVTMTQDGDTVTEHRKTKRVRFEPPLDAKCIAVDGTFWTSCRVIEASEVGAQLECASRIAGAAEFFLIFVYFPRPVFRRCRRVWINGTRVGVKFLRRTALPIAHVQQDNEHKDE
jgi:hypothetical protein